jgi:hypothetical protein
MKPDSDRRREPRVRVLRLVHVDQHDEAGELTDLTVGRTADLSQHGMRLELSHPLPLRARVRLTVALGERILTLDGLVRYVDESENESSAVGIEFLDLTDDDVKALTEFLGRLPG